MTEADDPETCSPKTRRLIDYAINEAEHGSLQHPFTDIGNVAACLGMPTEMKLSQKHSAGFYIRAAATFLRGTDEKEAVENLTLLALGNSIGSAVAVATAMEKQELA